MNTQEEPVASKKKSGTPPKTRRLERFFIHPWYIGRELEKYIVRLNGGPNHWRESPGLYATQIQQLVFDGITGKRIIVRRAPSYAPAPPWPQAAALDLDPEEMADLLKLRDELFERMSGVSPKDLRREPGDDSHNFHHDDVVLWSEVRSWLAENMPDAFPEVPPWAPATESLEFRKRRIRARYQELKRQGVRDPLRQLSQEEGLSPTRIKDLRREPVPEGMHRSSCKSG